MVLPSSSQKLVLGTLLINFGIVGLPLLDLSPSAVAAENTNGILLTSQQNSFDFSGDGRPGHRNGGGSRGDCPNVDIPLTALMPASNVGQTLETHPSLWLYVPYTPEQAPTATFILQDEDRNDLYRASVVLPDSPGIVSVALPDTVPALGLNQDYRWYLNVYCDAEKASSPVFLQGWIQRVGSTPALETQLARTPERDDLAYAQEQIWFDAIASLAEKRMANPTDSDLLTDWNALLNASGVNLNLPDSLPFSGSAILIESSD